MTAPRLLPALATLLPAALALLGALPAWAIKDGIATTAFGQVGKGVQITDNWVLTARHVGFAGNTYSNGFGTAQIAQRYDLGSGVPTLVDDLSLLRLATPIAAPALSLWADALVGPTLATPLPVTIVSGSHPVPRGYGWSDVREVITQIDPDNDGPLGLFGVNWLAAYQNDGSSPYVQGGDSGGGLFRGHVADSTAAPLMGITSALLDLDSGGHGSAFVQLAAYRHWIDGTMAADLHDAQLARWVSAVPEPAGWALWGAGLLALAAARRRRYSCSLPA